MTNALEELRHLLAENNLQENDIEAATVEFERLPNVFVLHTGHTNEQRNDFMQFMNREYDSGYGGQELYGTIWFKGATWAERGEYDGSEWWEHRQRPEPPKEVA